MTNVRLGTVIHGTMREEDLIPAFLEELEELDPEKASSYWDEIPESATLIMTGGLLKKPCGCWRSYSTFLTNMLRPTATSERTKETALIMVFGSTGIRLKKR